MRAIGKRRPEYASLALEHSIPALAAGLLQRPSSANPPSRVARLWGGWGGEGSGAGTLGSSVAGQGELARLGRAAAALVELCELRGVFSLAAPRLLSVAMTHCQEDDEGEGPGETERQEEEDNDNKNSSWELAGGEACDLALYALAQAAQRAHGSGHSEELIAFTRGTLGQG
ncbi:unnamed protein product, partial [Discosporangium mesarthrocarpum]